MKTLKNKIVVITGSAKGIGFEDTKLFLEAGAKVAICDLFKKEVESAQKKLEKYGTVFAKVVDIRQEKEIQKFIKEVLSHFGKIDILVNNAGILPPRQNFSNNTQSIINNTIDTNLKGTIFVTSAVINHMIKNKSGVIINMSSVSGLLGYEGMVVYCATKFGIRGFSEALQQEVEDLGIKIYTIYPNPVRTTMNSNFTGQPAIGIPPKKVAKLVIRIATTLPQLKNNFQI